MYHYAGYVNKPMKNTQKKGQDIWQKIVDFLLKNQWSVLLYKTVLQSNAKSLSNTLQYNTNVRVETLPAHFTEHFGVRLYSLCNQVQKS